jgi:IclR family acetate operon transcriptional repressor
MRVLKESTGMAEVAVKQTASTMRSLERAFGILAILRERRVPLRLSDIARESGLHLATTQRILNVLVDHGYVTQEGQGYSMGITSFLNSYTFLVTNSLSQIALPIMQELSSESDWTSSLSVRVDLSQVMISRVEGRLALRYRLPIGEPMALHLGGARVLAAALKPDELKRLLDALPEIRLASGEVITRREFIDSLHVIREQGYVAGSNQREMGAASVAVPVFGHDDEIVASLQISFLIEELEQRKVDWTIVELKRASLAITKRIP